MLESIRFGKLILLSCVALSKSYSQFSIEFLTFLKVPWDAQNFEKGFDTHISYEIIACRLKIWPKN